MADEAQSVEDQIIDQVLGTDEPEETPDQGVEENASENPELEGNDEESEGETEPEFVDVEFDGKVYAVPPELKDALFRTSDYTQKTQALAAERKEAEVLRATVEQAQKQQAFVQGIQQEAAQLQMLDYQIQQYRDYMRQNVDTLSGQELEKLRFHIEEAKLQKDELTGKLQNKWTEHQQAQQQAEKALLDKSTEVLRAKVPSWNADTEKAVVEYAKSHGFSDDEVRYAKFDPRQLALAHKAMMYDKLQQGKVTALQKIESKPAIKAKTRDPMPANVRKRLDLKNQLKTKNLSDADKAKAIGLDMADFVLGER